MSKYKITAICLNSHDPIKDRDGNILWDGKPKLLTLTVGEEDVTKFMYENMIAYTDPSIWKLKLTKVK